MDYAAALKQVKTNKPEEPFLLIKLAYDRKLMLPYKQGLEFMSSLNSAEILLDEWGKKIAIIPLKKEEITCTIFSREEYLQIKVANLLGVSVEDLEESQKTTT